MEIADPMTKTAHIKTILRNIFFILFIHDIKLKKVVFSKDGFENDSRFIWKKML